MSAIPESQFSGAMSEDDIEACARALQRQPDPKNLFKAPAWEILVESSKNYWRAKALHGERPPISGAL